MKKITKLTPAQSKKLENDFEFFAGTVEGNTDPYDKESMEKWEIERLNKEMEKENIKRESYAGKGNKNNQIKYTEKSGDLLYTKDDTTLEVVETKTLDMIVKNQEHQIGKPYTSQEIERETIGIPAEVVSEEKKAIEGITDSDLSIEVISSLEQGETLKKITSMDDFAQALLDHLKPKQDYGTIPGISKPFLLQPGAEKIILLLGLSPEFDILASIVDLRHENKKDRYVYYKFRCSLFMIKNGKKWKVAEGYGSANSMESSRGSADPANIENTLLKIAQKRAMVGAAKSVSAISSLFSQDPEAVEAGSLDVGEKKGAGNKIERYEAVAVYKKIYNYFGVDTKIQQETCKKWLNKQVATVATKTEKPINTLFDNLVSPTWLKGFIEVLDKELPKYYYNKKSGKIFKRKIQGEKKAKIEGKEEEI